MYSIELLKKQRAYGKIKIKTSKQTALSSTGHT